MTSPKSLALVSICLWSLGAYFTRLISIRSQFLLLDFSFLFTLITLLSYYYFTQWRSGDKSILKSVKFSYFLVGPLGYFIYWLGLVQSSRSFNSISETTILNYTWPMFTVVFSSLFHQSRRGSTRYSKFLDAIGIALGFLSIIILASKGDIHQLNFANMNGIFWGVIAGVSYGLFSAYSGGVRREEQVIFLITSVLISWVFAIVASIPEMIVLSEITLNDILVTFALGCLLDGFGYICWTRANRIASERGISISSIASIMFITPFTSLLIVNILLGESQIFQGFFIISLLLVTVSSIICQKTNAIESKIRLALLWLTDTIHNK